MARIFQMRIALYEPSENNPNYCVESYEKVRLARENRVLHFGYPKPLSESDVEYLADVIQSELKTLVGRTVGIVGLLPF